MCRKMQNARHSNDEANAKCMSHWRMSQRFSIGDIKFRLLKEIELNMKERAGGRQ